MGSTSTVDQELVEQLRQITASAEKNEASISLIKKNLEEISKRTTLTSEDSKELHKNYELLKQELLNQANLTLQMQMLTSGTPCSKDPNSMCPHACKQDELFMPQVLVCGKADDIMPMIIVWKESKAKSD